LDEQMVSGVQGVGIGIMDHGLGKMKRDETREPAKLRLAQMSHISRDERA
jgi:hypothetical protein